MVVSAVGSAVHLQNDTSKSNPKNDVLIPVDLLIASSHVKPYYFSSNSPKSSHAYVMTITLPEATLPTVINTTMEAALDHYHIPT